MTIILGQDFGVDNLIQGKDEKYKDSIKFWDSTQNPRFQVQTHYYWNTTPSLGKSELEMHVQEYLWLVLNDFWLKR